MTEASKLSADAPLTPADHVLASALSIHLLTVIEDPGWTEIVRGALKSAITQRAGLNSYAENLERCARAILCAAPRTPERTRAEINARNALVIFHQWRLGLAMEKSEVT